jgi:geranylgeranyl reductase family protein
VSAFDIVVIGGGPAGSAAAYTAAAAGLSTCIIDQHTFPREKLCGGLLTPRTKRLFEQVFGRPWAGGLALASDRVAFFVGGRHLANQHGYCTLFFTMRRDFDAHLQSLAVGAGASATLGDGVRTIDLERRSIELKSGERIEYGVLIGADGVSSVVARTLFGAAFDERTIGFGLEAEVPRAALPSQPNDVEIDIGAASWGYGWVFPKPSTFTIGVGGIHRYNPALRQTFEDYLARKGVDAAGVKIKGQYIPFGDYRQRPGKDRVLLCGDAAGVVDPITGEGIAYAIQTGHAAARAAASAVERRDPSSALAIYADEYRHVAASIRQANAWRHLIFPRIVRRPFTWAFGDAGTLQRGFLDILSGTRDYDALPGLFGLQAVRGLRFAARTILQPGHLRGSSRIR